jgi:hypothetical protein
MGNINKETNPRVSRNNNEKKNYNDRFKTLLFSFRIGGQPFMMNSTSRFTRVYSVFAAVCFYSTVVCLSMDAFVHRRQLVQLMKKVRVLIGLVFIAWTHFSFR